MAENTISRIISRDQLAQVIDTCRKQNKTIVITNGCFDILHSGHLSLLNKAKAFGDILIVGVNSDRSVKQLKGPERPLVNQEERAEILANLRAVDYVTIFDESTAIELLKITKPDIYVKGGDYNLNNLPEEEIITSLGIQVQFIDLAAGKSTTGLVNKIKSLS